MNRQNQSYRSDLKFSKAISKGFSEELLSWLTRRSRRLIPFEEVKEKLDLWFVKDIGIHSVPLDAIIGSQGRYRNFTRHFFPKDESLRDRWKDIDGILSSGRDLPPVELYKVCNAYFVKDGHHRISVARSQNRNAVEAKVFEYECDVSLDEKTDIKKLAILETYHKFLKETGLKKHIVADLHITVLGGYSILMEHIQRHAFYLSQKESQRITIQEGALSWYLKIYTPLAQLIQENKIMRAFPHRTETDFYIWIVNYRKKMCPKNNEKDEEETIPGEEARNLIDSYSQKYAGVLVRLRGKLKRLLGLVKYD